MPRCAPHRCARCSGRPAAWGQSSTPPRCRPASRSPPAQAGGRAGGGERRLEAGAQGGTGRAQPRVVQAAMLTCLRLGLQKATEVTASRWPLKTRSGSGSSLARGAAATADAAPAPAERLCPRAPGTARLASTLPLARSALHRLCRGTPTRNSLAFSRTAGQLTWSRLPRTDATAVTGR